jgi:hypothetical protein
MTSRLASVTFDAIDPLRVARFWAGALGWDIHDETGGEIGLLPTDGTRFLFVFVPVAEPKTEKNRLHLHLVSESAEHQAEMVADLLGLGARRIDVGQAVDAKHVVLADPEGNELCVLVRGEFVADTGLLGEIAFDPADHSTGYFWGEALGWPVLYDQDGDTAIRHPSGRGPFITFGPPGVPPKQVKNRVHLDLAPRITDDHGAEVDRLVAAGARRVDIGQGDAPWVVLADPDGNELCVLTPR